MDLTAIEHNVRRIRARIGPQCGVLAVVKANAYAHGLSEVARAAIEAGAAGLGVALLSEACELRRAGIAAPILILGTSLASEADEIVALEAVAGVSSRAVALGLSEAALRQGRQARMHLKIDSGMGRAGVIAAEAPALIRAIHSLPALTVEAVFTHFATADEPDLGFAWEQLRAFQSCLEQMRAEGTLPGRAHASNSAAALRLPEAHYDFVRAGLLLYGIAPYPGAEQQLDVRPALSLKARLVSIKDLRAGACVGYGRAYTMKRPGRIAILPLGYADGFSRRNSNNGDVLVRGRRAPIRGRICMDQFMVEVTGIPEARVGDIAVLLGGQGDEEISSAEIAQRTETITHETLSALTTRLPRRYV